MWSVTIADKLSPAASLTIRGMGPPADMEEVGRRERGAGCSERLVRPTIGAIVVAPMAAGLTPSTPRLDLTSHHIGTVFLAVLTREVREHGVNYLRLRAGWQFVRVAAIAVQVQTNSTILPGAGSEVPPEPTESPVAPTVRHQPGESRADAEKARHVVGAEAKERRRCHGRLCCSPTP